LWPRRRSATLPTDGVRSGAKWRRRNRIADPDPDGAPPLVTATVAVVRPPAPSEVAPADVVCPPEAVSWLVEHLGLRPGVAVATLGGHHAGLAGAFAATGARVVAVRASPEGGAPRPGGPSSAVVAEPAALPLRARSLDAAAVARLPGWLDADAVVAELGRVLRAGGRLGILRHGLDWSSGWARRVRAVLDAPARGMRRAGERPVLAALGGSRTFGSVRSASFEHAGACTPEEAVECIRAVGHVALLPPDQQGSLLDDVAYVIADDPETRRLDRVRLRYRADVWWCVRVDDA
jgi:SAM-dependent methyltransferase